MQAELQRLFGVTVDYSLALSGMNHVITMLYIDMNKSFIFVHVAKSQSRYYFALRTGRHDRFKYVYMYIAACIDGFQACGHPVNVVDATHLKDKYKCVNFVATTNDGNERIFPLVVAYVTLKMIKHGHGL